MDQIDFFFKYKGQKSNTYIIYPPKKTLIIFFKKKTKQKVTRSLGDHCNVRCGTGSVEPKQPY